MAGSGCGNHAHSRPAPLAQVVRPHELGAEEPRRYIWSRGETLFLIARAPWEETRCPYSDPHPKWVADLDAVLDPGREAILDTPVIVDASENQLVDGQIQDFLVNFYPIIATSAVAAGAAGPLAGGRQGLLPRQHRVEKRHDAMWRAMGDGFNVPKERFQIPEPMIPRWRSSTGI